MSTIAEPGVVAHTAGPATIVFGELDGSITDRATRLLDAFDSGVDARLSDKAKSAIWDKFAFICALSSMTAAVRLPIGDIRSVAGSWELFTRLLRAFEEVAAADGSPLATDAVARHEEFARSLEPGTFSSLHYDLTHSKPLELESLHGELVRRATRAGVAVPTARAIYGVLRPWAVHNENG